MITNINFNSMEVQAGDDIELILDASYPVTISIKCFILNPPPPRFVDCEEAGIHVLEQKELFSITTSPSIFGSNRQVHFLITDSDNDKKEFVITVRGRNLQTGLRMREKEIA